MNRNEPIQDNLSYHVYNRGNDRAQIFGDESDYLNFIEKMHSLAERCSVFVNAYALMPNHYHLLASQNGGGSLSKMMGALATSAAKRYNLKYGHIGHLFQGPFRYKPVADESLWYLACYIHLNPVRAGFVKDPKEWPFSNFAALCKRSPSSRAKGYLQLNAKTSAKVTFDSVWEGYEKYVYDVLNDEQMERELWVKVKGYLEAKDEGFLLLR